MNFLTGKIIQAVCWTLLHSLWQGLLLAVVTGVVMVLSKKSGSAVRYKLLSSIFILFIIITGLTFYRQMQLLSVTPGTKISVVASPAPVTANINYATPAGNGGNALQGYLQKFEDYFNQHASLIVTIWFIIFMARCVKILSGLVYIQRIRHYKTSAAPEFWAARIKVLANRLQIKRHILLLQSAIVKVPVVVGFLKPTILVPIGLLTNLSTEEVESILMHELAHIRRKDYFFNLLQCFVDIVFFFNPAVLWISSLIRNERENCCDDIAINETKNKKQFIQALVSFHQYNTAAVSKYAMPFAERKNKLVNRVKRIVNNNNHTLNPAEKIVLVGCLIAFSIAFITVSNGQTNKPKKPADSTAAAASPNKNGTSQKQAGKDQAKSNIKKDGKSDVDVNNDDADDENTAKGIQSFSDELKLFGYKNISVDKLVELRNHGVTTAYLKSLYDAGYRNISPDKAEELVDHGVSMQFINSLSQQGYKNISLDKAIEMVDQGVSAEFIIGLNKAGFSNVPLDKIIELAGHGVTVEFINGFRAIGLPGITLDQALELKDHGVTVEFVNSWHQAGFVNVTVEKAQELVDHGVSIEFINSFRKLGFNNISPDKAIQLRDHGVDAAYIEAMKKKTGNLFSLDEYISLKDSGFETK